MYLEIERRRAQLLDHLGRRRVSVADLGEEPEVAKKGKEEEGGGESEAKSE